MDADSEVEPVFTHGNGGSDDVDEEEENKCMRPPSSYGSMKSDSEDKEEEEGKGRIKEEIHVVLPGLSSQECTGLQLYRPSEYTETLYTMTTEQTKPPGAVVIETSSFDIDFDPEDDEEEEIEDEMLLTNSPEPPEPIEPDDAVQTDENGQPGRLHPEQDLPHVFKSIQNILTKLSKEELLKFKMWFHQWEQGITLQQVMEGDLLDFVDKAFETLGLETSLTHTINTLDNINKKEEAAKLRSDCKRMLMRFYLKQYIIQKHQIIREGVVQAGKQNFLDSIFVEPKISTCVYGGIDPSHELRQHCPTPLHIPSHPTFLTLNNLFKLKRDDSSPVRTVVTTGIPGIGMSVTVGKFSLDWAELRANKDLQFVIKLSFHAFWILRNKPGMSIMEVITYFHPQCKDMKFLEEEDCKFLVIMDAFDRYQTTLDWENTPVINDNYTKAHPDTLIVNIIRGTVLRGAQVWILGRAAAVSQIPSRFIDVVTEIQGFSDEMIDVYLTKRFDSKEVEEKIVQQYKRLPSLQRLARQPFVAWMVATVFERCYRYLDYGDHPPRLTPFYVNIMIVQMNRRLQFYYRRLENDLNWSADDKKLLIKMAKMAFKMLEKNIGVFFEEDVKEYSLNLSEVTVLSGMCTELPASTTEGRRTFCFIHFSFQEFMAALYVFTMFRTEAKNVLDSGMLQMPKIFTSKDQTKSAAGLIQSALTRTFTSELGHYDMFLRFLCGMLNTDCHDTQLCGYLYSHSDPKVGGVDEVQRLLEQTIRTAPSDRVHNLKECLREMIQEDE